MNETLTLNDGTTLEYSHALVSGDTLYVYIGGEHTLREVFDLFDDTEKTKKIIEQRYGETTTFKGYKKLVSIRDEGNNLITASLRK